MAILEGLKGASPPAVVMNSERLRYVGAGPAGMALYPDGLEAEAAAWYARVQAAGGTVNGTGLNALNRAIVRMKAGGIYGKLAYWLPFVGDYVGALTPVIGPTPAALNFGAADYAQATGLTGNGTTKYLNLNYTPAGSTGGIGVYTGIALSTFAVPVGCRNGSGTQVYRVAYNTFPANGPAGNWGDSGQAQIVAPTMAAGFWHSVRSSATDLALFYNGTVQATNATSAVPVGPGQPYYGFAQNSGGTPAGFAPGPIRWLHADVGLTSAEAAALYGIVLEYQTALARA